MKINSSLFRCLAGMIVSVALVLGTSGCGIPFWVGALGAGVVGGYVVSPDTVEGTVENSFGEAWDAAKEVTKVMGTIISENEAAGQIIVTVSGTRVTVTMLSVNASTTKLSVKARKSFMPKIDVSQDVYTKIVNAMTK